MTDPLGRPLEPRAAAATETASATPPALMTLGAWTAILASIALVLGSAVPAIAREMGLTEVRVVRREFQRSTPVGQTGADAVRDFEKDIGKSIERLERDGREDDDDRGGYKISFLPRDARLRKSPSAHAGTSAMLRAGTPIIIIRRDREWALVQPIEDEDAVVMGWVEARDLDPRGAGAAHPPETK